jgi:ADP-ribose pyrophosphatase YjhB (NUDIX family)
MKTPGNFVIRVYGIIVNENREVLLSDEFQLGMRMTKFPGGGLEFGEGTIDGLKREFMEECNGQELMNINHFYTTDFFQKALFYDNKQLLSIYYTAELAKPFRFQISMKPFDFQENKNGNQSFRWVKIKNLNEDEITFPIDKFVAGKLKQQYL